MRKYGGWRPVKHAVGVWLTKVNTAWRTENVAMTSNARGIYPEQCARTQILHNGDTGWVSTEFLTQNAPQQNAPQQNAATQTESTAGEIATGENTRETFSVRPQAIQNGNSRNLYIDRVNKESGKFYVFFTGSAAGDGGDGDYGPFWNNLNQITLINQDNPSQTWKPIDRGEDENFTKVTTGFYLVFKGVTGNRFTLRGADNYAFEEIELRPK